MTTQASDPPAVAPERRAAADALYRRHAAAIRRYAVRRVGDGAADDVVAAVFASVLTTGSSIPDVESALPWLYTIVRHAAIKATRTAVRHVDATAAWRAAEPGADVADGDPGERLAGDAFVSAVFADLRDDDAELLRLIVWEDLDIATAARVLGIKPGTARVRLHRVRRAVQRRWSAYEDSGTEHPERGGASR